MMYEEFDQIVWWCVETAYEDPEMIFSWLCVTDKIGSLYDWFGDGADTPVKRMAIANTIDRLWQQDKEDYDV